jgi:hypothetical protein
VMHGAGDLTSDIDLFVIFEGDFRQIEHKFFNDVPCKFFLTHPNALHAPLLKNAVVWIAARQLPIW